MDQTANYQTHVRA